LTDGATRTSVGRREPGTMLSFTHEQLPSRVVFAAGALDRLAEEVDRLRLRRVLVLSSPGQRRLADEVAGRLGERVAGIHAAAVMHVPAEVARRAQEEARLKQADGTVAIGGGSTIGLAKMVGLVAGMPIIAVPTTYAGSEMTPIFGLTEGAVKRTGRDLKVLPRVVVYDPLLTLDLPAKISGPSGMNAIAHCVEALYAPDATPVVSLIAEEGIRALGRALPVVVREMRNVEARSEALYGAWLAGSALGAVAMSLHHKLCHTLGGSFNLPHAETHTIVLPHAARYNEAAAPEAMRSVARALGADDAPAALYDLAQSVGAPLALKEIGLEESDLDRAAELATQNPYHNPRPVEREAIRALLDQAFHGRRP
jgi:maleylacetate reductase